MTTIDRTEPGEAGGGAKPAEWLPPLYASFLRRVCTMFGLHRRCPYKVCRRANACATRHVVCYQSMEAEMQPIVQSIVARIWRRSVDAGEERDVAPAYRDGYLRRLAREEEEISRIRSGGYGGDDALTAYQLWLKYWAERAWRPGGTRSHLTGGEPYDPDARERDAPWTPPKIVRTQPDPQAANAAGGGDEAVAADAAPAVAPDLSALI
jgi:hypothetical protein